MRQHPEPAPSSSTRGSAGTQQPARRWLQRVWGLRTLLIAAVTVILALTSGATIALWPSDGQPTHDTQTPESVAELVTAQVVDIREISCEQTGAPPSEPHADAERLSSSPAGECLTVQARLPIGEVVAFDLDSLSAKTHTFQEGDRVRLVESDVNAGDGSQPTFSFYDYPRGAKMLTVAIMFALIVIAVGRLRGGLALVGVGAAILLTATFILPAILAGESAVLVAITGATGIMVIVLYLAHGISHRTTAALFGSIFGILFTATAGYFITRWLRFTGISSTEDASLAIAVPNLHMNDVLTATIVIAGLGILNDITVAQASAVWEMRGLNPHLSKRRIYRSAMRVGRDHIASSIYTLVFAYAGTMLVVLLLLYAHPRDLVDLVTAEQIGQEVIRTLIGAAGLVLSMPVTTGIAVLLLPAAAGVPAAKH